MCSPPPPPLTRALPDLCAWVRHFLGAPIPVLPDTAELLEACRGLYIVAYEDGLLNEPVRRVQRVAARRKPAEPAPLESRP